MLSNVNKYTWYLTIIRQFFASIDGIIYGLLVFIYKVFLNVANQNIIGGDVIKSLIGRLQLIVGIFFLFSFAVYIVQGIVNPDIFTDREKGFSKIIGRVIIGLILLMMMIPLNIPGASENVYTKEGKNTVISWEGSLNEQGILFGTLTYFQNRVLETNLLGKLILGRSNTNANGEETFMNGQSGEDDPLDVAGEYMATEILRLFIQPNLNPQYDENTNEEVSPKQKYVCGETQEFDGENGRQQFYNDEYNVNYLFGYVDNKCNINDHEERGLPEDGDYYQFVYLFGFSTAAGVFLAITILFFTIDISIRIFKLVVLRILGPIAAISYASPKVSKDGGMFGAWVKSLFSTYIDIFLRLGIIYFVIYIASGLLKGDFSSDLFAHDTTIGVVSLIFIIIGLFFFARMAPKYIKDTLGLKGNMGNVGLAGFLGGSARLLGGGGLAGFAAGALAGAEAQKDAYNQGKQAPIGGIWGQQRDLARQIKTGDKNARGGFVGKLQDRFDYMHKDRVASKYGFTKENEDKAKKAWLNAQQNQIKTDNELKRYEAAASAGQIEYNDKYHKELQDKASQAAAIVGDTQRDYEKIKTIRDKNYDISGRVIDEYGGKTYRNKYEYSQFQQDQSEDNSYVARPIRDTIKDTVTRPIRDRRDFKKSNKFGSETQDNLSTVEGEKDVSTVPGGRPPGGHPGP